jgi:predicted methyltransferase
MLGAMTPAASRRHAVLAALVLTACAGPPRAASPGAPPAASPPAPDRAALEALLSAPDRSAADRALDASRRPAELLAFLGVRPGMRVAELAAADGWTAELLARAVGPDGTVWAQNSRSMLAMVGPAWARRLERPAMRRVVRVDRELEDPLPPEARGLDLVVMHAVYHDTLWLDVDRGRMNRAVLAALAPGGSFVIVDSSAAPGAGREAAYDLHRVDEQLVRREVEEAGFRLAAEGSFLRHPEDARDWSAAPNEAGARRGTSDRFALRFVRP